MRIPKYRRHSVRDIGFVEYQGERHYFPGTYNSPESFAAYRQFLEQHIQPIVADAPTDPAGKSVTKHKPPVVSVVSEMLLPYLDWAESYYGGGRNGETSCLRLVIGLLNDHYGNFPLSQFSSRELEDLQSKMVAVGWSRPFVNRQVGRIRRIWRWGVKKKMVDQVRLAELLNVDSLRKNKTAAPETEPIKPVGVKVVAATVRQLSPIVAAMVRFQWRTGCRPQDVCNLRWDEIDRTKDVWVYRPGSHKRDWAGEEHVVMIGPRSQRVLRPFLSIPPADAIFSPKAAQAWIREKNAEGAKFKNKKPKAKSPKRAPGKQYGTMAYRNAIQRAARRAGVEVWAPNQIRHTRGTAIRKEHGLEAAQAVLGHTKANTTEIYAEKNLELARDIARKRG